MLDDGKHRVTQQIFHQKVDKNANTDNRNMAAV